MSVGNPAWQSDAGGVPQDPVTAEMVVEHLRAMFLEERSMGRHHEIQRAAVSTILVTLATALMTAIVARWSTPVIPLRVLPLALTLVVLGVFGFLISGKLFERATLHMRLSEAYLNTLDGILRTKAQGLLSPAQLGGLGYMKSARELSVGVGRGGPGEQRTEIKSIEDLMDEQSVINPRHTFVPTHNFMAVWFKIPFALLDLFELWAVTHLGIALGGMMLAGYVVFTGNLRWSVLAGISGLPAVWSCLRLIRAMKAISRARRTSRPTAQ